MGRGEFGVELDRPLEIFQGPAANILRAFELDKPAQVIAERVGIFRSAGVKTRYLGIGHFES